MKPIKPNDVSAHKLLFDKGNIPEFVIKIFNDEIAKNSYERMGRITSKVIQKDVVAKIMHEMVLQDVNFQEQAIYGSKWLDIEEIYREQGWKVWYDKPAYYESTFASFSFEA